MNRHSFFPLRFVLLSGTVLGLACALSAPRRVLAEEESQWEPDGSEQPLSSRFGLNFSSTVYGPSAGAPARPFQPMLMGPTGPFERPILIRGIATLSFALAPTTGVRTSGGWDWTPTDPTGRFQLRDPQLHFYDASIASTEHFNWYGDFRVIPALTPQTRRDGLVSGLQTFHDLTLASPGSRWSADAYFSLTWNILGPDTEPLLSDDLQTYAAPHVGYTFSDELASSLQLEFTGGHRYGAPGNHFYLDTVYAVPGLEWTPAPNVALEPYVSIPLKSGASLKSTALGFSLSWDLL